MKNENQQNKPYPKRFMKSLRWMVLLMIVLTGVFGLLQRNRVPDPIYEGKRVSEWFEETLASYNLDPNDTQSPPFEAFREIEGDAIDFLIYWLDAKPSKFEEYYHNFYERLPSGPASMLPESKNDSFYAARRNISIKLLGFIGNVQRLKAEGGYPMKETSISSAVPKIRSLLQEGRTEYAHTLWFMGPSATPAVPELIELAKNTDSALPIQSFGYIGPSASNAVPFLIEVANDPAHRNRDTAIRSLGHIGKSAQPVLPLLVSLLDHDDPSLRRDALRSIAEIGLVPDDAVPQLEIMAQDEDQWIATLAAVALWNRDLDNIEYQQRLIKFLHTDRKAWLLSVLKLLGTNTTPLADEVRLIAESPDTDPNVKRVARAVLIACELPLL